MHHSLTSSLPFWLGAKLKWNSPLDKRGDFMTVLPTPTIVCTVVHVRVHTHTHKLIHILTHLPVHIQYQVACKAKPGSLLDCHIFYSQTLLKLYLFPKEKVFTHIFFKHLRVMTSLSLPKWKWTDNSFLTHFKIIPNYLHYGGPIACYQNFK